MGQLEAPHPIRTGIGKSAAHMAEHLTFKQRRRDSSQVDLDKRLRPPLAVLMNGLGDEFLARSTLPHDQHGGIGSGYPAHRFQYFHKGRRLPDDVPEIIIGRQFFAAHVAAFESG